MRNRTRLYVPIESWPAADRERWQEVLRGGRRLFDESGAGAHLAPASRVCFQDAYARLMAFVSEQHQELFGRPACEWLNVQIIEQYVAWQPARTGPRTTANNVYWLGLMLRYMHPEHNWSWLFRISNRLTAQARRLPRQRALVTSDALYSLGCRLMDSASTTDDDNGANSATPALQYRDGLIIALLAAVPIRRRTLAALRIGRHVVRTGETWALDIPAELVKTRRPLAFSVSPDLSQRVDVYVRRFRVRVTGARTHDAFWPAESGKPMSYDRIYKIITRRTRAEFGFAVRPHDFRSAAGTFWSIQDPRNVRGVRDLLGHANFQTTEQFYIAAQSRNAGRTLARAVNDVTRSKT
ncbi:MAG: tyrosine-type recombinase/integrase [Hyphomicrobiales bacterium]|nr:tyrosine-type recombinase/integrase [Hyphomicrobiales bacterium]